MHPLAPSVKKPHRSRQAMRLILLLGLVSLFADATYESARSIFGPYLAELGADAATVGMVAGMGELIGYGLRFLSGWLADRTRRYWGIALIGFSLNMVAVPFLALAGRWEWVAGLLALERTGKAIRNPPRDAILSNAAQVVGRGWGFGLQEALGQVGAVVGPLLIAAALYYQADYRSCLAALAVPAFLTILLLAISARAYPIPRSPTRSGKAGGSAESGYSLESMTDESGDRSVPRLFWLFLVGASFIAAGNMNFPLLSFHALEQNLHSEVTIPALYAMAMGAHAVSALSFGVLFDRFGPRTLLTICFLMVPIAPLALGAGSIGLSVAMILWGLGMGAQKAMFKATIARMVPAGRRGFGYGCFDFSYGFSWFLGSTLQGYFYDHSLTMLIVIATTLQLLAAPLLWVVVQRSLKFKVQEV